MLVTGENSNASNRSVTKSIASHDREFLEALARVEAATNADFVGVNVGNRQQGKEQTIGENRWRDKGY